LDGLVEKALPRIKALAQIRRIPARNIALAITVSDGVAAIVRERPCPSETFLTP